jgi:hypothetical protein
MENKWTKTIQTSAFDESKFKVGQAYLVDGRCGLLYEVQRYLIRFLVVAAERTYSNLDLHVEDVESGKYTIKEMKEIE